MLGSLKRRKIMREREEAVGLRETAARDFVAALREAEAALNALRGANDKFYRSDVAAEQVGLQELRGSRERMFAFHAARDVVAEAPHLARVLNVKVTPVQTMPLVDWIQHTSSLDLKLVEPANQGDRQ
ncbi:hypothetical protein [Sphingomonas sp. M1A8_2b]